MLDALLNRPSVKASLVDVEAAMRRLMGEEAGLAAVAAISLLDAGGSRTRARLALGAAAALGHTRDVAVALAAAVELLHTASLVHDDIHDAEETRRGAPSLWRAHGRDVAICAGDLMISAAFGATADLPRPGPAIRLLHAATARTIGGQCQDLTHRGAGRLNRAAYRALAAAKSGPLLALPLQLALDAAGEEGWLPDAAEAATAFAVAYQILDDMVDVDLDGDAPNAVWVAMAEAPGAAHRAAALWALAELSRSDNLSRRLPRGSGDGLLALSARLGVRLTEMRDAT